jgi:spore coat polysaccharide biosynthesis protein SpsF (cytidylyltransferase family)
VEGRLQEYVPGELRRLEGIEVCGLSILNFGECRQDVPDGEDMPNVVAIVQARMASTRLSGKVMTNLNGDHMIGRIVERVRLSKVNKTVVATTTNKEDDAIADLCRRRMWECFRGDGKDVLTRFYHAAMLHRADVIVRVTGDCPLIDTEIINECIDGFLEKYPDIDYMSNLLPRTYPRGLDVEVISLRTLTKEWLTSLKWREHVTLNLRKNKNYRIGNVSNEKDYSSMRWCVDSQQDLDFANTVYKHFNNNDFTWRDVLGFLTERPDLIVLDKQVDPE